MSENEVQSNIGTRFDRLPATDADRTVEGRPSKAAILTWWDNRFGIDPAIFDSYSFWEKGAGKIWIFASELKTPLEVEGLGLTFMRTRQEHWKPTSDAVQRFGRHASKNIIHITDTQARRFVRGEDLTIPWSGDWGYVIVAHKLAERAEPLGVGLYLHGELRSQIPKGSQRDILSTMNRTDH